MVKIAVIGGRETVLGFKALGLDVFPVEDGAEAKPLLRRLAQDTVNTYAIIYVEENLAEELDSEIEKYLEFALISTNDFYQYASNYQFTQKRKSLFANLEKYWNNIKKPFNQK